MRGSRGGRRWVPNAVGAGLLAAAALGVGGCSGGSDPAPSDSTTSAVPTPTVTSVSPTPSPSVSVPDAARAQTPEGAVEFAKFYVQEASDAYVTADAAVVRELALPQCSGCEVIAGIVDQFRARGAHVREPRLQLEGAQLSSVFAPEGTDVDVVGKELASEAIDSSGTVVQSMPEERTYLRVSLVWGQTGWAVAQVASVNP